MSKLGTDVLLGTALILFGLGALYELSDIRSASVATPDAISSSTLPTVYAVLLVALSALMVITSIVHRIHQPRSQEAESGLASMPWAHAVRAGGTLGLLTTYVLALSWVPFFAATAVFLAAMLTLYGRKPLWRVLLLSVIAAGSFHWLFIVVIKLPI